MDKIVFYDKPNKEDKNSREITCEEANEMITEAQKKKTFSPVCSAYLFKDNLEYYKIIYFVDMIIFIDLINIKQIWYEKISDLYYFIDKIIYKKYEYENKIVDIEAHFRNHTFSEPNICMINIVEEGEKNYYIGEIDETVFYRTIKFGEIDTFLKDLQMHLEKNIFNIQKCNEKYERK